MNSLRIEAEAANSRAEKAEAEYKVARDELARRDAEVASLKNKIQLLNDEVDRAEKRIEEVCI